MKKTFKIVMLLNLLIVLLVGCNLNNPNPFNNDSKNITFSEGWWMFSTGNSEFYFYYDTNKEITRAGTDTTEYKDVLLDSVKSSPSWKWDFCANNSKKDSRIVFKKVGDDELPEWVNAVNPLFGNWKLDTPLSYVLEEGDFGVLYYKPGYLTIDEYGITLYEYTKSQGAWKKYIQFQDDTNFEQNKISCFSYDFEPFETTYNIIGNKLIFSKFLNSNNVSATFSNCKYEENEFED